MRVPKKLESYMRAVMSPALARTPAAKPRLTIRLFSMVGKMIPPIEAPKIRQEVSERKDERGCVYRRSLCP
jgi:hypothetical protein